jgi:hypothetical protein
VALYLTIKLPDYFCNESILTLSLTISECSSLLTVCAYSIIDMIGNIAGNHLSKVFPILSPQCSKCFHVIQNDIILGQLLFLGKRKSCMGPNGASMVDIANAYILG